MNTVNKSVAKAEMAYFDCIDNLAGIKKIGWYLRLDYKSAWQGPYSPIEIKMLRAGANTNCIAFNGVANLEGLIALVNGTVSHMKSWKRFKE
jgi:hypothetical protein